ncbi:MAG: M20/M25/M40 family metallo-hydrolase [Oscillospiraceae bacterium]|nr:M20/M25/M40 family metallo-hydrolase [Oscillospiraceae bacterium]
MIEDILIELCALPGPAGFEQPVAERCRELLAPYMTDTWIDVLGNAIGVRKCGKDNAPKLLFDAHVDEIGLIITGIEEGFLRFHALGGLDARTLPAAEVQILSDPPLYGVICVMPPHVLKKEDTDKALKIEDLFIDIGLNQEDTEKAIQLGTPGVMYNGVQKFGDNLLCGKALDDRAGFAAILCALELLKDSKLDVDLYVMASAQEEVGTRGAETGAFAIDPDYCVVIDVGHAKTPDSKPQEVKEALDKGVIISRGPNMNRDFTETAVRLAKEQEIPHQIDVVPGGSSGTNARAIQISRNGVVTALFGLPMKYMHTPFEVCSIDDIESAAKLMCEMAKSLKGGGNNA